MITRLTPPPAYDRWEDYFEPDEKLVWQGQPEPGLKSPLAVIALSIFGIPFLLAGMFTAAQGVSALFDQGGTWGIGGGLFFIAFSVPFLMAGLGMTFGSWLAALYGNRYIRYALTNKRAYIAKSFIKHALATYTIKPDDIVTLEQGRFDSVKFKTVHGRDSDGDKTTETIGFDWIKDGPKVYQLVREHQNQGTT